MLKRTRAEGPETLFVGPIPSLKLLQMMFALTEQLFFKEIQNDREIPGTQGQLGPLFLLLLLFQIFRSQSQDSSFSIVQQGQVIGQLGLREPIFQLGNGLEEKKSEAIKLNK